MDRAGDFGRDGFVVVHGLLTAGECAALKAETQRIVREKGDYAGVFVGLAANSDMFREMARHPRLLDALESVIGPDISFLSDKVVFKSAAVAAASPWHQDWPYWKGAHKTSVWVALDAATIENGCLKLLPGSHTSLAAHDGTAGEGEGFGHRLAPDAVDESKAFIAECAIGDAVIFHDLTLHASFPNVSGQERYCLISTYRNAAEPDFAYAWASAAVTVRGTATKETLGEP